MRSLAGRRGLSAVLASTVTTAFAAVAMTVLAPVAQAAGFSGTAVSACHLYFASGLPGTPAGDDSLMVSNSTFAITGLSLSTDTPASGDTVTVTLTSSGFTTGPAPVTAGGLTLTGKVAISGAQSTTVTLLSTNPGGSGSYPATAKGSQTPMGAFTLTGTFVASGSGAITAAYQQIQAKDNSGANADNWCDGTAAGTSVINPFSLTTNGSSVQTTNYVAGTSGFKATRVAVGTFVWDVPAAWDPRYAADASSSITATATISGVSTATPTPTTASPTPTSASPTPTSASPTPTTGSPTPSGSPTPTPSATPVVVNGLKCQIFTGTAVPNWETASANSSAVNSAPPTFTFAASSLEVAVGDKVDLALSFSQGPQSGPVPLSNAIVQPKAKVKVGGAATGAITLVGPKYGAIAAYAWIPGTTMTAQYTATAAGTVSFTLDEIGFDYGDPAADTKFTWPATVEDFDTVCNKGDEPKVTPATIGLVAQEGVSATPVLPPTLPTSNGALTVTGAVKGGGTVTLSGSGFKSGTIAAAGMYSDPVTLGQGTADSTGKITVSVTIPSGTTGSHTLILLGTAADGSPWALTKAVTVAVGSSDDPTDDPDNDGTLPQTGAGDAWMTLLWAAVALQIGLIVAVRASRSRRTPSAAGRHR